MTRFFTAGQSFNPQQFLLALPCVYSGISEQWHLVVTAPFKYKSTVLHAQTDERNQTHSTQCLLRSLIQVYLPKMLCFSQRGLWRETLLWI